VILDIKPVADVLSVPVDRDGLAVQRVQDGDRDQLFGEMVGAVVVGAVGQDGGQAVGFVPRRGPDGRTAAFDGGIGRARVIGRVFGELAGRGQGAEDLVGRDVVEAEGLRAFPRVQWARAASSRLKVPVMLVSMKSAGPSMDRSTWLSAARCITASGAWVAKMRSRRRGRGCRPVQSCRGWTARPRPRSPRWRHRSWRQGSPPDARARNGKTHDGRADEARAASDQKFHACPQRNGDAMSARSGALASLSDRIGAEMPQSMPIWGSSQRMAPSWSGL
jgi:hypothetical protein